MINRQLKSWAGISRTVDNGLLFRGLGLTEISARMQLIKCELLRTSKDNTIQKLYKTREAINSKLTRVWKASKLSSIVNAEVELNLKFPVQDGNQGIGFGNFDPNPSALKRRCLVTSKASAIIEESHLIHSLSLKQQSVWLQ